VSYSTLQVRYQDSLCFLQINRPQANNTINEQLVSELTRVLGDCEESATVIVLSGLPEVFCLGADFTAIAGAAANGASSEQAGPGPLYDIWLKLATGPYVTVAHVKGKANAGGVGFVAACDIVVADQTAQFSLSEMLFGLHPACVLPFLIRRIGFQKAHALTLLTQPISVAQAQQYGLVDSVDADSDALLRRHLMRLRRLSKPAIRRYKSYVNRLGESLAALKPLAVGANLEVFSDPVNLASIARYVEHGTFPWQQA